MTRRILVVLAALLLGAVAACGSDASSPAGTRTAPPATDTSPEADEADAIAVVDLDGEEVLVPEPGAYTVTYFYGVGCPSCVAALEEIAVAKDSAPADTTYLAININPSDEPGLIREFFEHIGNPGLILLRDPELAIAERYDVAALGTTLVFDPSGEEVFRGVDPNANELVSALDAEAR